MNFASWVTVSCPSPPGSFAYERLCINSFDPDIQHFVLLMQENRSFDHYFGTLSGTNGFNAASPLFQQAGWNPKTQSLDPSGVTLPYRFDTTRGPVLNGACVNDPNHDWGPMHSSWNNGAMNNWLPAQASSLSAPNVAVIMGYYTRQDIPIHYMLADTFTVCDNYHCSVLGPTIPNRLYWVSAALGFDGTQGGPQLVTLPASDSPIQLDHHGGESQRCRRQLEAVRDEKIRPSRRHGCRLRRDICELSTVRKSVVRSGSLRPRSDLPSGLHRRCHSRQTTAGFLASSRFLGVRTSLTPSDVRRYRDCGRAKDFAIQSCGVGKDRADHQL
jgi:hypothetical protein